jgi:taurine dioxygenase
MTLEYTRIKVRPLAGRIGADIYDVDLSQPLADAAWQEILRAFHEHIVLHFHDQVLTPDQHIAFTKRFGPISHVPFVKHMAEHPDIVAVRKEPEEVGVSPFGNVWHADFTFLEEPPLGSVLYAREVPEHGGDTMFANMYAAYEALSGGMRRMLDRLNAMHAGRPYGAANPPTKPTEFSRSMEVERGNPAADKEFPHPVVRVHPVTGKRSLFVNSIYTTRFEHMTGNESRSLLRFLFDHATSPDFTCRLRWKKNDLAVWDNRCSLHYAISDYDGHRRLMHRTTMAGERPAGVFPKKSLPTLRDSYAPPLLAFLRELGAERVPHSRRTLFDHLVGTAAQLEKWGADDDLCRAGLFHSIYGTERFEEALLPFDARPRVREQISERAERLAWIFCAFERRSLFRAIPKGEPYKVELVAGKEKLVVTRQEVVDLLSIFWANSVDQLDAFDINAEIRARSTRGVDLSRPFLPASVCDEIKARYAAA